MRIGKFSVLLALVVSATVTAVMVLLQATLFEPLPFYKVLTQILIGFVVLFLFFSALFGFLSAQIAALSSEKMFCADCHKNFLRKDLVEVHYGISVYDGCPYCKSASVSIVEESSDHQGVEGKVIRIVAEYLEEDPKNISVKTVLVDGCDTITEELLLADLAMELEDGFNIPIPDGMSKKWRSVGDAVNCIADLV